MWVQVSGEDVTAWADQALDGGIEFAANVPHGILDPTGLGWTIAGDDGERELLDPSGDHYASETSAGSLTGGQRTEIADSYGGTSSYQTIAVDLELEAAAGKDADSAFLAPGMFNLLGDALTKTRNYLAGAIGAFSVTGSKETEFQAGGVVGIIMDGVTEADAPVVAVIDGSDPSSETRATAAFAARQNNAHPDSGVDYGLDLHDAGRGAIFSVPGEGLPLGIAKADLRLSNEVCILNGAGAPVDYTDGSPPATGEGYAEIGSLYIDRTAGALYINTGTKAQPTWEAVGA